MKQSERAESEKNDRNIVTEGPEAKDKCLTHICERDDVTLNRCLNSHCLQDKPLHVQRQSVIYSNCVSAQGGMTVEITECKFHCQYL